ncbi:MAG: M14 family zinc carboxypeptidase [Gammaproteobacteria bacterium]
MLMKTSLQRSVVAVALALLPVLLPAHLSAQNAEYFPTAVEADFDPAIPTPEQFLGYPIGTRYTRHDRLVEYFRELDRRSPRVQVVEVGHTYEHRPLVIALITSEENHARLEDLREAHARLVDPSAPDVDPDATPVVVGLYYSVHGNETSSGEAAMLTAYYLAAHRGPQTERWLKDAIVLIDPAQNPDGRDRAANWHNAWSNPVPVADPDDKEHVEPFPMGRTNHYFTDLNRDWLAATQRETQLKLEHFHRWYPNVQIDFHEMGSGSTYYFEPSPAAMHSPLVPQASYDFNVVLARYHQQALDARGVLYFTREIFDNFSAVYGSTYPDFHGGVGVTVEQASSRGLVQDTPNGRLEFRFTIRNQLDIGLATIRGAVAERAGLFKLQRDFFRSAVEQGRKHSAAAFIFGDPNNQSLSRDLLSLLLHHRIRVHELREPITIEGHRFEPGSAWVVPSAQPQFRLVHSIFELTPPVQNAVYGSTSYAIAPAYGIRHGRSRRVPAVGPQVLEVPAPARVGVIGGQATYAYAIDWRDSAAVRVLQQLHDKKIRVRAAFRPFRIETAVGEHEFGRGSLVVPVVGQALDAAQLHEAINAATREAGVVAYALSTGRAIEGVDLGSNHVKPLRAPKIALVMGQGVNATEIGSTWFALAERVGHAPTRLDPSHLSRLPVGKYTSIVLAGGQYDSLGEPAIAALRRHVEAGGSLVAFGSAARWAQENGLLPKPDKEPHDASSTSEQSTPARVDYAEASERLLAERMAGNMVSADVDPTHPLAFGIERREFWVHKETDVVLPPTADPYSMPVKIDDSPRVNGYLAQKHRQRIAGTPWATVVPVGAGNVVAFADDPAHRKYWRSTERLLLNALFFFEHLTPPAGRR